jgi:structural maintenance of chromosome 4
MFELADYLVGIYKVEDCTHSVTIQNYDKQRALGFGENENEVEKENKDENSNQGVMHSLAKDDINSQTSTILSSSIESEANAMETSNVSL